MEVVSSVLEWQKGLAIKDGLLVLMNLKTSLFTNDNFVCV